MDKVRAYRSKQRGRSISKGGEGFDDSGPLQQGLVKGPKQPKEQLRLEAPQSAGMQTFFARVSEAKVCLNNSLCSFTLSCRGSLSKPRKQ